MDAPAGERVTMWYSLYRTGVERSGENALGAKRCKGKLKRLGCPKNLMVQNI